MRKPPPELERALLARNGSREGDEIRFRCPFPESHNNGDANPSARYSPAKNVWRCDACGKSGGWTNLCDLLGVIRERDSKIASAYSYSDENGALLFQVVRKIPKGFVQRRPDGHGGWIWSTKGVRKVLYRLPEVTVAIDEGRAVYLVEGEKDADNLADLGLTATTNPGGAGMWSEDYTKALRGAQVVIFPDNDTAGREHALKVARALHGFAAEVRVVELPDLPRKGDVSDWIDAEKRAGRSSQEICGRLEDLCAAAAPEEPSEATERCRVIVGPDEKRVNDEALEALAKHPDLYCRGNGLVQILQDERPEHGIGTTHGDPRIAVVPNALLREMLSAQVDFRKPRKDGGLKSVGPPGFCVRALSARGQWPALRPLEAVTQTPVLLPDGTILQEPGYDGGTGIAFFPKLPFPPISGDPSRQQVEAALALLREAVCDFPFARPRHESAFLAAILTLLARHAFSGSVPLVLVDANTRGSGKGLLVDVAGRIGAGRDVPRMAYSRDAEEQRKTILAHAMEGHRVALIDNVSGSFGTPTLDAALTATIWTGRILGVSKTATAPLKIVWFATANNVTVVGDTVRRCLYVRLESPDEHPERRQDFRHPRLLDWVDGRRAELTAAGLTLLRAYIAAGRPDQRLPAWGSFGKWSDLIRNCLVWLELPDPGETRGDLYDSASGEEATLENLVIGLDEVLLDVDGAGGTAREILQVLQNATEARFAAIREALAELVPRPAQGGLPSAVQLGAILKQYRGRVIRGRAIEHARQGKTKRGVVWCVQTRQGDAGDAGDADSPHLFSSRLTPPGAAEPVDHQGKSPSPASPASPRLTDERLEQWQI